MEKLNTIDKVDLKAIQAKIPKVAFELFRFWTYAVGITEKIIIKTEQALIQDLEASLKKAILALREKDLSQKTQDWCIDFVYGFIEGNLCTHWDYEYIAKTSESYKILSGLKAINTFLLFDELTRIKIEQLYEHIFEKDLNIEHAQLTLKEKKFDEEKLEVYQTSEKGKVLVILQNLIVQQIQLIVNMKSHVNLPISSYFSKVEIQSLIDDNLHT